VIEIAGVEIWITETLVNTWIIMLVLIAIAIVARIKLRRFQEIPKGFQNAIEIIVEMFDNFAVNAIG
jgi:F-type H+-transporting ATPase subunit a